MASAAFAEWRSVGLARLDELEQIHANATGTKPGRRWGTAQINRSLFVALVAQFQTYCRALHDEAVQVHVVNARPGQAKVLRTLLQQGRKLEAQTPRASALGSDFGRLGFGFTAAVKAARSGAAAELELLDVLVDFRNAIGHGNETEIAALVVEGRITATKKVYRRYRRAVERLARTMDMVVAGKLRDLLRIPAPW